MLQKSLLILSLLVGQLFGDTLKERPDDTQISSGSGVSDIPYGFYMEGIAPDMLKLTSSINLNKYANMRFFAGYGLYDIHNKQCKFVDTGVTEKEFFVKFEKLKKWEGKSYAISRERMGVSQCVGLAAQYNGYMYTPESFLESDAIIGKSSELYSEEAWIGVYRPNCSTDYQYIDSNNNSLINYKNFYEKIDNCSNDALYVYKPKDSVLWRKGSGQEMKKCIIEINSEDITRPVRVCAPWWRIERTYKFENEDEVMINGVKMDMYGINQATLPKRMNTCLEYIEGSVNISLANRNVICKTYYDMSMGSECLVDPMQSSCFVDGCSGYIKNVCSKNEIQPKSEDGVKDYAWGYINDNGVKRRVKVKQEIQSHAYTCPPSAATFENCKESGEVIVFPYECDPEVCASYKKCVGDKTETRKECYDKYPCVEVYGDATQPILENDQLVGFRAKCGERMIENRNIDKLSKTTNKCMKYKTIVDEVKEQRKCTVEAKKRNYNVKATLTEEDLYSTRSDCVRINDPANLLPKFDVAFQYTNNGFFNLAIVKSFSDGEKSESITQAPNTMAADLQYLILKQSNEKQVNTKDIDYGNCGGNLDPLWHEKRISAFTDTQDEEIEGGYSGLIGVLKSKNITASGTCGTNEMLSNNYCFLDANKNKVVDNNLTSCPSKRYTLTSDGECRAEKFVNYPMIAVAKDIASARSLAQVMGLSSINVGKRIDFRNYDISFLDITTTGILGGNYIVIGGNAITGDNFIQRIKIVNASDFTNSIVVADSGTLKPTGMECKEVAECLDLKVNTIFSNPQEKKVCSLISQDDEDNQVSPPPLNIKAVEYPKYEITEGVLNTNLNGITDIYSIQEYADGKFGYASNFHFPLPKNNKVSIDGKEIFPIVEQHALELPLQYRWHVSQRTQRTKNKEPSVQDGSYDGAMISASNNLDAAVIAGIGVGLLGAVALGMVFAPAGAVVAIIVMMFASQYKWGDFITKWQVEEKVTERYVKNIYGYDLRLYNQPKGLITYTYEKYYSPTARDNKFEKMLEEHAVYKKTNLYWQGYDKGLVDSVMMRPCELGVCGGYPGKIKWYKPRGKKTKNTNDGESEEKIVKLVNNVYLGATNSVSIFVPYLGDYVIGAYNKYGTLIGEVAVSADDFLEATIGRMSYANVGFAQSSKFMIAPKIKDGAMTGACRDDINVEWGGGVSGVYYEKGTPAGNFCDKSNDSFVQDNLATYITVRPIKANKSVRINLIKPMPYANRFFIVTYGAMDDRKYICYEKGAPCEVK